jgi:hypothetical protein
MFNSLNTRKLAPIIRSSNGSPGFSPGKERKNSLREFKFPEVCQGEGQRVDAGEPYCV